MRGPMLPIGLQHGRHLLVNQVDGLQGPDHDLELGDLALFVPRKHVDPIDAYAVDLNPELQHRVARAAEFADVPE